MPKTELDDLPEVLKGVRTRPLFVMRLNVRSLVVGAAPGGQPPHRPGLGRLVRGRGAAIAMTYRGVRHGPIDVIGRMERGEAVAPATYYFRINPMFETAAASYDWLNRILAIGIGHRRPDGPVYSVFEVL
jgi:uncharacterized protein DUF3237